MLEGGIIAKLLEEKWKTFAQVRINVILFSIPLSFFFVFILSLQGIFFKRMFVTLLHLLAMSVAIYSRCLNDIKGRVWFCLRPPFEDLLMNGLNGKPLGDSDAMRYCFEVKILHRLILSSHARCFRLRLFSVSSPSWSSNKEGKSRTRGWTVSGRTW